jgi:molybdenum cofactor cytidylyltransferase
MAAVAAVVLAAGASRRFGSDKLLYRTEQHGATLPLIAHSLKPWLGVFGQVTVVVQPQAGDLRCAVEHALADHAGIRWVECPTAAQGMAASLACGVVANMAAAGWLIGLADMPAVPPAAISQVRNALETGASLAAPFHDGRRGHPVGFSANYRDELLALKGDTGARSLLKRDAALLQHIEIENHGILIDIDRPADLHPLQR